MMWIITNTIGGLIGINVALAEEGPEISKIEGGPRYGYDSYKNNINYHYKTEQFFIKYEHFTPRFNISKYDKLIPEEYHQIFLGMPVRLGQLDGQKVFFLDEKVLSEYYDHIFARLSSKYNITDEKVIGDIFENELRFIVVRSEVARYGYSAVDEDIFFGNSVRGSVGCGDYIDSCNYIDACNLLYF